MRTPSLRRLLWLTAACLIVLQSSGARAWKIDVHVWIANEVLRDAQDGRIELDFGNKKHSIELNPRFVRALKTQPQAFLTGSLGPDTFPDVVAGQLVIHPGIVGGWGTAEWLRHLHSRTDLSDKEVAFTLGFLTHAATDIFAHTFVNRYAGDVFDIKEHRSAATRHIYLESFVSNYLPPLRDPRTGAIVNAVGALRSGLDTPFAEALIQERMVLNTTAADQYKLAGSVGHLRGAHDLHRELQALLSQGGFFDTLEARIIDFSAQLYLQIPIDDQISKDLQRIQNDLSTWLNGRAGEAGVALQKLNDEFAKLDGLQIDLAQGALSDAAKLSQDIANHLIDIASLDSQLVEEIRKRDQMLNMGSGPFEVEVSVVECLSTGITGCILSGLAKKTEKRIPTPYQLVLDTIAEKQRLLSNARSEVDKFEMRAQAAIKSGFEVVRKAHDLHRQAMNRVIAFVADKPFGNSFRNHFERWHEAIPRALTAFTRANLETIVNSVDPAKPSMTEPLKNWLACHGAVFLSVPNRILSNVCFVRDGFSEIKSKLDAFEKDLAETVPIVRDVYRLKKSIEEDIQKLQQRVLSQATQEGLREFDRHAGTPTFEFYKALTTHVGSSELNAVMSVDSSGQSLPLVADAAERILSEMHVTGDHFDPQRFHAVYNGIVLSKLALLDQRGLQALARLGDVRESAFGHGLFSGDDPGSHNILFGFIRSIDGNHQWHDLAPPHPRASGFDAEDFQRRASQPDYSYSYADRGCQRKLGMRLWADTKARETIFKRLFRGKLVAGIDAPEELSPAFLRVLPSSYPNLFDQGESWEKDGITLTRGGYTIARLAGSGKAGTSFRVTVNGTRSTSASFDMSGNGNFELRLPEAELPAVLEADGVETESGTVRLVFDLGCGGTVVGTGVEHPAVVQVQTGDSLWRLAARATGDGRRYAELFSKNRAIVKDPDRIYPEQRLTLPWEAPLRLTTEASAARN